MKRVSDFWRISVTTSVKFQITSSTIVIVPGTFQVLAFACKADGEWRIRSLPAKFERVCRIRPTTWGLRTRKMLSSFHWGFLSSLE